MFLAPQVGRFGFKISALFMCYIDTSRIYIMLGWEHLETRRLTASVGLFESQQPSMLRVFRFVFQILEKS